MKKRFKSALGIVLAVAMLISFAPVSVFAEAQQEETLSIDQPLATPTETPAVTPGDTETEPAVTVTPEPEATPPATAAPAPSPNPDEGKPAETPKPPEKTTTSVQPILTRVVDKPLVKVVYHYYDAAKNSTVSDFTDYSVASTHSYYAIVRASGKNITIAANKYPGLVPVSTDALRYRVLLNGSEDITVLAAYDAATGLVSLPGDYMGHEITVEWYCPASEITELPVKVTICVGENGKFTTTTKDLRVPSNTNQIIVPIDVANGLVVSQNGLDLSADMFNMKSGNLIVSAPALGGDIAVSAYALSVKAMGIGIMPLSTSFSQVVHTRSSNQIFYGYYTSYYTANGNTAFCLDPNASGLNSGTYSVSRFLQRGRDDLLIKCAYYLYGGPGYNSIKHSLFSDPDSLETYGLCHAAAAYAYLNDPSAFQGLSSSTISDLIRVLNIVNSQPMPPNGFDAFIYNESSSTTQSLMGWDLTPTGDLEIIKVSSNPAMSDGNSCYSLEGAVFDVYDSGNQKIGSVTTNASGKGKLEGIAVGSGYYLVEVKPPKGFALNSTKFTFAIAANQTTSVTVSNIPQNDPIAILLQKLDADTASSTPQGNAGLAGAEFTIKYYKGLYSSAGQLSGLTPERTWVVRTDANGAAFLNPSYLVSGDPFYYAGNSDPTIPLGTVTVQETKAPVGYLLNNTLYIRQITSQGTAESVFTYNAPDVPDDVVRGGVSIEKWDFELDRRATPQGGATLAGSVLEIYNRSANSVVVGGKTYVPGAVVYTMTTDATGTATTANDLLPYGDYEIIEKTPPTGYLNTGAVKQSFQIRTNLDIVSLKTTSTTIKNHPIRGGVEIEKWDNELNRRADAQGDATLEGAVFEIWNRNANIVLVNGTEYAPGTVVCTLTTNADGWAGTANDLLPYGSYEIIEKTPPTGYLNTGVIRQSFEIKDNHVIVSLKTGDATIKNNPIRGGVEIEKWDIERDETKLKQGDATLEGAVFEIWNRSSKSVLVGGTEYAPDTVVYTLTTNADGWAGTANDLLPYGSYEIIEKTPPEGYLNTGTIKRLFQIREHGVVVDMTAGDKVIKNDIIRGGVKVEKWDNEIDEHRAQGGATLEGAVFEIVNLSKDAVLVENTLYAPGEVVYTFKTDKTGTAITPDDLLPYGTYEVREVSPPLYGYLATGILSRTFTIREHKKIVEMNTTDTAIKNNPVRGDLKGVKIADGDAKRLANVPFKITSVTTGESHVIVTDRNGEFNTSSSWNPHSQDTNRGETDRDGVWFGEPDTLNNDLGALLYDTYILEELPCEANKDKELLKFEASVYRHMTVVDLGTLTDDYIPTPEISTTAMDQGSTTGSAYTSDTTTIVDTVYYSGLKASKEYTLKGTLYEKTTGKPLLIDGKEVTAEKKFKAQSDAGSVTMQFTFNALALQGKAVVVFESLEFEGKEVASHADINDEGQTVTFSEPKIGTSAAGPNGEKELIVSDKATIVDTVSYTGLTPGETYTVKGVLMDKSTGKALLVDGKEVAAETTFKAAAASGTVKVTFTFNALDMKGKTVVVFESLEYKAHEIAVHADINDQGQTVTFKNLTIKTSAAGTNGEKELDTVSNATIVDTVSYTGLTPGETHTLKGVLMDKATGRPLLIDNKEVTAETTFKPASESGTVKVTFTFNATGLMGKTVVVYESLVHQGKEIAVHADIEDQAQTVKFRSAKIGTSASARDGGKKIPLGEAVVVIDKVAYINLEVGKTYTLKGVLMDKATGKPVQVGGKQVTAEKEFTPTASSGNEEVIFTFDSTSLSGKTLVVFESLTQAGKEVAAHNDINDQAQTVTVEGKTPGDSPQTGRDGLPIWLLIVGLLAAAGSVALILYLRKRGQQAELSDTDD